MICRNCRNQIPAYSKYCGYCGTLTGILPIRLFRRIPSWARFSLIVVCIGLIGLIIYLLAGEPDSQPGTTSESLPILTEPIVTNMEIPTVTSKYLSGTVTVMDGVLADNEWPEQPAFTKSIQYVMKGNAGTGEMAGYIMNDDNNLYIALQVTAENFDENIINEDGVFLSPAIWFDGDNDGVINLGEDIKRFWQSNYVDSHVGVEGREETDGKKDGAGRYTYSKKYDTYTFELQIPLFSGDDQDLAVSPGATIGIKVILVERQHISNFESNRIGTTGWPTGMGSLDASTYAKLILSSTDTTTTQESLATIITALSESEYQFEYVWEDDFNDASSGWPQSSNVDWYWEWGYKGSHYYVLIKEPGHSVNSIVNDALGEYTDFVVAVDCWLEPGDSVGSYGLVFRESQQPASFYRFHVQSDGSYYVGKWADGKSSFPVYFTKSPHIKTGGQVNRLMVVCYGPQIEVYINGALVAIVTDDSPRQGSIRLEAANASDSGSVRILFDNFYLEW